MANRIISIEVGYSVTKVCEMDFRSKNPKVYKYFSIPTPEGVYDDGFLTESPQFATAIKQALGFNKIKTKQAVCTVTSSKIATREVQLPAVKDSQLPALVEANAGDYFPINLSDYELGHLVLGSIKDADGTNKLKVLVMACNKQLIQGYDKLCEACGLHLISVDYSGNSVYQVMKNEVKEDTEMVIKIEEKQSLATIITGQSMVMQRNIVYGLENAIYTMMNNPAFPQKTYEEAVEELKRIRCIRLVLNDTTKIIEKDDDELQVSDKVKAAMVEITDAIAPLIGNIERVIDLYNSKSPDHPIKKISIIGLGADISGLSKLLTNEIGVKTIVCNNIKNVSWNHTAGDGSSGRYVSAIGAAIAPIGFVNEEKKKADLKDVNYRNVSILLVILTAVICGALYFMSYTDLLKQKEKQKMLQTQEAQYLPAEVTYNKYNNIEAFYSEVVSGREMTKTNNDNLLAFLEQLEKTLPEDSYVSDFSSDNVQANLSIETYDLETVAKIIQNIRKFDCARNVIVNSIAVTDRIEDTEEISDENLPTESEEVEAEDTATGSEAGVEGDITEEDKVYTFNLTVIYWDSTNSGSEE